MPRKLLLLLVTCAALLAPLQARAGIPVIDFAAIANLIQQIMYWQQQISAMQKQFDELKASKEQLKQTYESMSGSRGMEQLLATSDAARNYLPSNYADLRRSLDTPVPGYAGLSEQVRSIVSANSVLSTTQMDALSPELRQLVEQGRQSAALLDGMTQTAFQNTSQRFSALQTLITAIARARDPKAIQELQARIQGEQNMLTNEQTKLQALYQLSQADEARLRQRTRERVVSGHGEFSRRFTPTP